MAGYAYSGMFPNSLDKAIDKEFGAGLEKAQDDYKMIGLKVSQAPEGNVYTESQITGLGDVRIIGEGQGVQFDIPVAGNKKSVGYSKFGLGFAVTEETIEDAVHKNVIKAAGTLGTSAMQKLNRDAFGLFNGAFDSVTGWDGSYLCVANHTPLKKTSVNISNVGAADLGATSLDAAFAYFRGAGSNPMVTEEGFPLSMVANTLMVSGSDYTNAHKLLKGELIVGSPNNDINVVNPSWGAVNSYSVKSSPFLTDADAWFLYGPDLDFRLMWKKKPTIQSEVDFHTGTKLYKAVMRYAIFAMQYKGLYGSPGA